jgi:hypothetical protein
MSLLELAYRGNSDIVHTIPQTGLSFEVCQYWKISPQENFSDIQQYRDSNMYRWKALYGKWVSGSL